jgi:hypothetical protein
MNPDSEPRRFSKTVAIKELDTDDRTATGAVLVPWELDRQGDFLRPEAVTAMYAPDVNDGVMHARFPDDAAELVEHEVADEPIELNGEEYPAGTEYATRKYHDDELWSLVEDGILSGFSIGGEVSEQETYSSLEELPDEVSVPAGVDVDRIDEFVEIKNGFITEISDVDIPAVPRAMYTTAKSTLEKNLVDDADGVDDFVDTFTERGHSEDDAQRLYEYLESVEKSTGVGKSEAMKALVDAADVADRGSDARSKHEMSNQTDKSAGGDLDDEDVGFLKRLRKTFSGTDVSNGAVDDDVLELVDSIEPATLQDAGPTITKAVTVTKEGRTLNQQNRETLMAAHDAIEATLAADMDHEWNRFTDDTRYSFDLTSFSDPAEKAAGLEAGDDVDVEKLTAEQGDLVSVALERFVDSQGEASYAEFEEWLWTTGADELDDEVLFAADSAMREYRNYRREQRDQLPVTEEFGAYLADEADIELNMGEITETLERLEEKVEDMEKRLPDDGGDAGDGTDKNADGADGGSGDDVELADRLEELTEKVDSIDDRVDAVAKDAADTDQLGGSGGDDEQSTKREAIDAEKEVFTR